MAQDTGPALGAEQLAGKARAAIGRAIGGKSGAPCATCARLISEARDPGTPARDHVVARVRLTWHRIDAHPEWARA